MKSTAEILSLNHYIFIFILMFAYPPTPKHPATPRALLGADNAKRRKQWRRNRRRKHHKRWDDELAARAANPSVRDKRRRVAVSEGGGSPGAGASRRVSASPARKRQVLARREPPSPANQWSDGSESQGFDAEDAPVGSPEVKENRSGHPNSLTSESHGPPRSQKNGGSQGTHVRFGSSSSDSSSSDSSSSDSDDSDSDDSDSDDSGSDGAGDGASGSSAGGGDTGDADDAENETPNAPNWWRNEIDQWFLGLGLETQKRYKSIINKFVQFLKSHDVDASDVKNVTLHHMKQWIQSLEDASNDKKRKYTIVLKSFWKTLFAHMSVVHNWTLALKLPPRDQREQTNKYLSPEQVRGFLNEARRTSCVHVGIFGFMYFAGLRVAEVCELKKDDITYEDITTDGGRTKRRLVVLVRAQASKGSKRRRVRIGKTGMKYMVAQVEHLKQLTSNDYLFTGRKKDPVTRECRGNRGGESIYKIVKKFAQMPEIRLPKVTPHWFRHAFATHARKRGVDIKAISKALGHSSIKTTEIYIQTGEEAGDF